MKFNTMRWQEIYNRLSKDTNIVGAEIGVWTGKTSNYLLEHLPKLTLYMIDAWDDPSNNPTFFHSGAKMAKYPKEVYDNAFDTSNQIHLKYYNRSFIRRMTSAEAVQEHKDNSLDFCFIDGDHSREGVAFDIDLWLPKVKSKGLLCGHDLNPNPKPNKRGFWGVAEAVYERFPEMEVELADDHTWFYWKK